jgi:hypothetical protein
MSRYDEPIDDPPFAQRCDFGAPRPRPMTTESSPASLLLHLYRVGATIAIVGESLEISAPDGAVTSEIHEALVSRKARLFDLLAFADEYREVLRRAFAHGTSGSVVSPEDARGLLDDQTRLIDELGPPLAAHVAWTTGRQWQNDTSNWPWDDAAGASSDPTLTE